MYVCNYMYQFVCTLHNKRMNAYMYTCMCVSQHVYVYVKNYVCVYVDICINGY